MEAIAHNKSFAKKVGIPQSVGEHFSQADKGKKFSEGGRSDIQTVNKKKTDHGKTALFKGGGMASEKIQKEMNKQLPKGISKSGIMPESKQMGMLGMKKGGMMMGKMAMGGKASDKAHEMKQAKMLSKMAKEESTEAKGMKKGGVASSMSAKMGKVKDTMSARKSAPKEQAVGSAKMGSVKRMSFAKGGGIESKGKTKGKVC